MVDLDALDEMLVKHPRQSDYDELAALALKIAAELRTARATIAAAVPCDAADKAVMRLPCAHANPRAKLAEQAATIAEMESELTAHRALRARLEPLVEAYSATNCPHVEVCDETAHALACAYRAAVHDLDPLPMEGEGICVEPDDGR